MTPADATTHAAHPAAADAPSAAGMTPVVAAASADIGTESAPPGIALGKAPGPAPAAPPPAAELIRLLDRAARLAGQRVPADLLEQLAQDAALGAISDPDEAVRTAWRRADLDGEPAPLTAPSPADLPFMARDAQRRWLLVTAVTAEGAWRGLDRDGDEVELQIPGEGVRVRCLSLPKRNLKPPKAPSATGVLRRALWAHKGIFINAIVATGVVNLLTVATSLYAMQVFDRVIPNQGFDTLMVLTVGVALSISMELLLKHLRSYLIDHTGNAVDHRLAEWFFRRMMGIRMEARPQSVGTLASQVKGFEMVRGVMASTSIFVLADVPFAIFFIAIIAMIGGPVVLVPLIAFPIALTIGLLFQRAIMRHTRENLAASNRKAGLLVEAVDGAEGLKSYAAEWTVQGRWRELVDESAAYELKIRRYTATSQNVTVTLQQLSYIALVATGAYLVTQNALTMGGLLACSIIGNRAMAPIVQLPGVIVQWANARAALHGLQQIIGLPNEQDEAHQALMPQTLQGHLRFDRARFVYGQSPQPALEVERLEIRPGERVGLVGPIGSGKSTLLKLASGLYRPSEGKVYLGGIDLASLAPAVAREHLGYLPQEPRLFSGTLKDNILLGIADPGEEAILAAARRTGLIDLILGQPAGLALPIAEGGRGVSGGQKQLIGLTRLLLAKPKVWLLDEPTGSLDNTTEARVIQLLGELADSGATLLVSTHKSALLPMMQRLLVVHSGKLQLDGPRDAILARLGGKGTAGDGSGGGPPPAASGPAGRGPAGTSPAAPGAAASTAGPAGTAPTPFPSVTMTATHTGTGPASAGAAPARAQPAGRPANIAAERSRSPAGTPARSGATATANSASAAQRQRQAPVNISLQTSIPPAGPASAAAPEAPAATPAEGQPGAGR